MTIDLANPAHCLLLFGGIGLWTLFCVWALSDIDENWPKIIASIGIAVSMFVCFGVAIIALFFLIAKSL